MGTDHAPRHLYLRKTVLEFEVLCYVGGLGFEVMCSAFPAAHCAEQAGAPPLARRAGRAEAVAGRGRRRDLRLVDGRVDALVHSVA